MNVSRYNIELDIDFSKQNYTGSVEIHAEEVAGNIALDSEGLEIYEVATAGKKLGWKLVASSRKLLIYCGKHKKFRFSVRFAGKAKEGSLQGFYRSRYKGGYILTTQFEPTGARSFIPCFDNPTFKSVFRLKVKVDRGLSVISNMAVIGRHARGKKTEYLFSDTPRMSTYLLYLGIGKFEEQRHKSDGKEVIVASVPGQKGKGKFAIDTAVKCLREYEDYYGIAYPLDKLHLIGIPEYSVGAMENWGSITFRENLLYVDRSTSESNKRQAASVIAHEIAHQWFGNLVTMKWWNDLWLNESFATYMSYKITDKLYPEWNVWSDFLLFDTGPSMQGDSLRSTHPIDVKVREPEEISQIFDEISYGKGGSVLRMIDMYVGDRTFRKGVNKYLRKFRYSNASSHDFWNALRDASGMRIDTIMKAWITKPGYPVISVKSDKKGVTLEQRRFTFKESASKDRWPIPITYKSTGGEGRILFDRKSIHIAVGDPSDFLINESRSGYFRVEYDDDIYSSIYKKVRKMNPHARWGIISDLFAFLAAGRISEKLYFSFADLLSEDDNYLVVNEINSQLKTLCTLLPGPNPVSARYNKFCHLHLERIGIEGRGNEDRSLTVLRENLCDGLVMTDDKFAANLSPRFSGWNNLKPELKQAVAVAYARTYGASGLNKLIRALKDSKTDQDATKITISLASFRDESAVMKALELSFTGDLNIGHVPYVIISCSRNPDARRVLWKWFRSNDGKLIQAYSGTGLIAPMIEYIISGCGIVDPEDVRQYFAQKSIAEATRAARKGLEQLDINLSLIKKLDDIGNAA